MELEPQIYVTIQCMNCGTKYPTISDIPKCENCEIGWFAKPQEKRVVAIDGVESFAKKHF